MLFARSMLQVTIRPAAGRTTLAHMRFWEENGESIQMAVPREPPKGALVWNNKFAHDILNPIALARLGRPLSFDTFTSTFAHHEQR